MFDPLHDHDSNRYNEFITNPMNMSIQELNAMIDYELLTEAVEDIAAMPASMREAAILDFEEIDPVLGMKLRLELCFVLD